MTMKNGVVVRPSSLIDEEDVKKYKTHSFQLEVQYLMMAKLVELMVAPDEYYHCPEILWEKLHFNFQMPVIYNKEKLFRDQ